MAKLTKRVVEGVRPREKEVFVWDNELPGFGLRVFPSGRRAYLVQYRHRRRTRRLTLGTHGVLTPAEARRAAREVLGDVARGKDPAAARTASQQAPTMADLAQRYLSEHASTKKKASSVETDARNLRLHVLPRLGSRAAAEIDREEIARLHHAMRATPGAANRVLALLSKMFNLAERWGLRPNGSNPCRHVERYRERKCERFLSPAEIARLGDTLAQVEHGNAEPSPVVAAVRLLMLTGARRGEIVGLRWEQVDLERGYLRLPDSKSGEKVIPLNAPARDVLARIERCGSPWVFPAARRGETPVSLSKPWGRIRARAGLTDVRIHDLRHTFASLGAGAGMGLPLIGRLLGHTQAATTQRYAHLADDPVRQASEVIGSRIAAAMSSKPKAEVVEIGRKA